jgi:hypothetical protein
MDTKHDKQIRVFLVTLSPVRAPFPDQGSATPDHWDLR